MKFPVRTPQVLMRAAPSLLWHKARNERTLYLSFDDGPHPEITLEVLDLLAQYQAKATFFCVGQNVERFPGVVRSTLAQGHAVGNHTHHHLNGWKHPASRYLEDIALAETALRDATGQRSKLFRPPYGKLGLNAWRRLASQYAIVMWDVVAGDFAQEWPVERVQTNVLSHALPGSVVVLHDSEKSHARMIPTLRATLEAFSAKGFAFKALP
jgi:peptidoglycan/xylan/chitin deacetylase (PgdA/CDA1 family)